MNCDGCSSFFLLGVGAHSCRTLWPLLYTYIYIYQTQAKLARTSVIVQAQLQSAPRNPSLVRVSLLRRPQGAEALGFPGHQGLFTSCVRYGLRFDVWAVNLGDCPLVLV